MADSGIPLGKWSGSDATDELRRSIEAYNVEAAKATQTLIRLTWAIVALTVVLVIGLGLQVYLELT